MNPYDKMISDYARTYNIGYKHPNTRTVSNKEDGVFLRVASIVRVDYEDMTVDVIFLDSTGGYPKVPLTAAYAGYRSFLGAMPQIGDWLILGFAKSGGFRNPFILQFLPRGYKQAIKNDKVRVNETMAEMGFYQPIRFKMQKLYEGEIYGASKYGSEFLLDKNVSISNSKLNEIFIKSSDQSISFNAINLYQNFTGIRVQSGLIHRNALIEHPLFQLYGNTRFPIFYDEEGVAQYIPVYGGTINSDFPYGRNTINTPAEGFVEHRTEIKEMSNPIMGVTSYNSGVDVDSFYTRKIDGTTDQPLIIQVLGTLVGNDPAGDDGRTQYGTILRPSIFRSTSDLRGELKEISCVVYDGKNEIATLAAAYTLKVPNSGTAFYINKQGKYFANIASSSTIDPLGAGESAEINLTGHAKVYMGQNVKNKRSLTFATEGGVSTNWGFDNEKGRSWDATFRKGVSWNILGKDKDYFALNMNIQGNTKIVVNGTRYTEIKGGDVRVVRGALEDTTYGVKKDTFIGNKFATYGGSNYENVMGHCSQMCALGKETTILAPYITKTGINAEVTDIVSGNSSLNMLLGNRIKTIVAGMDLTFVLSGSKTSFVTGGDYSVIVGVGAISIATFLGTVSVDAAAGIVSITGGLAVNVTSGTTINLSAPLVNLGVPPAGAAPTNAVVTSAFPCYITGMPHLGSPIVRCGTTPGLII